MKDIVLITPPFTQLNTPYPATAYLKGFLNTKGIDSYQMDLGIEVILELFSSKGLKQIFQYIEEKEIDIIDLVNAERIHALQDTYLKSIDPVISFLQGKSPTIARKICSGSFLPQGARFEQLEDLEWAFGNMGLQDKAKHLATLYLEDISDFIKETIDPHFGFSRYAERLGRSANSFDELHAALQEEKTYIDQVTLVILEQRLKKGNPKLVCFSVPFPGNLYSAFRCAQYIKQHFPSVKTAMGGGFANTELRSLSDSRVFQYFDYITLDDGELPIELLISNVLDPSPSNPNHQFLKRTFLLEDGAVIYNNFSIRKDYAQADLGTPDYSDLMLDNYIHVIELANPMHSLWSDGRWNKLTMAHGCYWGKCTFCDVSLSYIKDYEPLTAKLLVDRMETMIAQTGERGFHFVDEAAPPALMRELAIEILSRRLDVTWWTNIRFEKSFTADLCRLLMASGCVAVSGGLEVATDRLLAVIQKGVTLEQVAQVTNHFTQAGIMVHAYLMYGYPTQTVQETVDSLEMVRQLFELGVLQSGFWHQFALTAHSPIGLDPEAYKIKPIYNDITFANNDVVFDDSTGIDHDIFSFGLKKSLFNYMHQYGFDYPLQEWFDFEIPETQVPKDYIHDCVNNLVSKTPKDNAKVSWVGSEPQMVTFEENNERLVELTFNTLTDQESIVLSEDLAAWLMNIIFLSSPQNDEKFTFQKMKASFELAFDDFDALWNAEVFEGVRNAGLLIL